MLIIFVGVFGLYTVYRLCCEQRFTAPLCYRLKSAGATQVNGTYWLSGSFEGGPFYLHENKQIALLGLRAHNVDGTQQRPTSRNWHLVELRTLEAAALQVDGLYWAGPKTTDADPPKSGWTKQRFGPNGGAEPPPEFDPGEPDGVRASQREAYRAAAEVRVAAARLETARRRDHQMWQRRSWEERRRAPVEEARRRRAEAEAQNARQNAYHRSILPRAPPPLP